MASLLQGSVLPWVGLLLVASVGIFFAKAVWWVWWRPKRLERFFRQQGMEGNSYWFPLGDALAQRRCMMEAQSSPMHLSHDIVPHVFPWIHQNIPQQGKIYFTWAGPYSQVVIQDPHVIRDILSHKSGHITKMILNPFAKLLITGIINYEGEKWAKHKRIISLAFHVEKLKLMVPAFLACCTELIDRWENMVALEGSCELDVWPEFQIFTGDVISRTAFGSNYEEGRRIFQLQVEQAGHFIENFAGSVIPGYRFLPTKRNRRMKAIDRELKGLLRNIIIEREKDTQFGTARNDDFLGLLLESNRSSPEEDGNPGKSRLTTEEVIEECRLFYFAGQESTSTLLTWTVVVLSMHQTWQGRAREEVLRVFGRRKPEFEGLSQLKVVTMVLQEVLRLYPSAPFTYRTTGKIVKLGKYCFPPGVGLSLPLLSVHHDPEIWGDDALQFNPERFSEGVSKASKNQAAYFPFGFGPRICIGQNFAMLEAKLCLAMILQRFSFELSPSYMHAPLAIITLQPQYGAQIILHKL